jgi:hypothetical protein
VDARIVCGCQDMTEDPNGDILLVTMRGQIEKLDEDFGHLRSQFNPAAKVRSVFFWNDHKFSYYIWRTAGCIQLGYVPNDLLTLLFHQYLIQKLMLIGKFMKVSV